MKVFIGVDMEGVSGVLDLSHTSENGFEYSKAREWLVGETNAAIEGALAAGATEIWVNDSHGGNSAHNMLMDKIHPEAQLLSGNPKLVNIDDSFDVLIQVGQHTMNGRFGVVSHSINGRVVKDIRINGRSFGEVGILAALAGHFGVPTAFVAGDDQVAEEAKEFMPWVNTGVVKWALGRSAARCLPHQRACDVIRNGVQNALENLEAAKTFQVEAPLEIHMEFKDTGMAEGAHLMPGTDRLSGDVVAFTASDFPEAHRAMKAMITLAMTAVR